MTVHALDQDAPDVEDFLCCWLAPLVRTATERRSDDPLPFCVVTRISGADDVDAATDEPVVQIDIFDTARNNHRAVEGALNISRMGWNATAEKTDMDRAAVCAELAKLDGAPGKEEIAKMVDEFIAKKLELYPEEKNRLISPKSRPQFNKDGTFTIMASTIDTKPEGLVKPEGTSL